MTDIEDRAIDAVEEATTSLEAIDDDISDYYGYPIAETARANDYGEPFEDDIALLRTCLKLRGDYDELSNTTPPYAALVAIASIFDPILKKES